MGDLEYTALAREIRTTLESLRHNLGLVHSGIVVAAEALRHQAADHDPDVADVLRHCLGSRLYQQIEQVDAFLESLNPVVLSGRREAGLDGMEVLQ